MEEILSIAKVKPVCNQVRAFLESRIIKSERRNVGQWLGFSSAHDLSLSLLPYLTTTNTLLLLPQVEAHPYLPQDKLKAFLDEKGMALVAYSPLGNLDPNDPAKPSPLRDEAILGIAKKHGKSPAQVVIRWQLQKGHVVIPKTVTLSRFVVVG